MKLIDDWRKAWQFLSVQVSGIFAAAVSAWMLLPHDQREDLLSLLPFSLGGRGPALVVLIGFVGVIVARIKSQPGLDVKRDDPPAPPPPPPPVELGRGF